MSRTPARRSGRLRELQIAARARADQRQGQLDEEFSSDESFEGSETSFYYQGRQGYRVCHPDDNSDFTDNDRDYDINNQDGGQIQDGAQIEDGGGTPRDISLAQGDIAKSVMTKDTGGGVHPGLVTNSARISRLEGDINKMRKQFNSVNANLDFLVSQSVAKSLPRSSGSESLRSRTQEPRQRATDRATQQRRVRSTSYGRHQVATPATLRSRHGRDGFVERELEREEYQLQSSSGKHGQFISDIYNTGLLAKPYMYWSNESANTLKQKLDVRNTINSYDYLDGFVGLLRDPRATVQDDLPHMLRHLQDVIRDTRDKSWGVVRKWSQGVFDAIEKGEYTWKDYQIIQNERFRTIGGGPSSSSGGGGQPPSASGGGKSKQVRMEFPCREFNSARGCRSSNTHTDNGVTYLHCCTYCDSACKKRNPHSVIDCENKIRFHAGTERDDWRQPGGAPKKEASKNL